MEKEPLHGFSYRAEGCGVRDMTQFLIQHQIPKEVPVSLYCENLSGVQKSLQADAPY